MKAFTPKTSLVTMLAMAVALIVGCGPKEQKKDKGGAKPEITDAKIGADGTAQFSFKNDGSGYCKFATNEMEGEWYECNGSTAQYPLKPNQSVSFFYRSGKNGPIAQKTLSRTGLITEPTDETAEVVEAAGDPRPFGVNYNIMFANRTYRVPPGSYITRLSTGNGAQPGMLDVYEVVADQDPLSRTTICDSGVAQPQMSRKQIRGVSTEGGLVHDYCNTNPQVGDDTRYLLNYSMAVNSIQTFTENDLPREYTTLNVFTDAEDELKTKSAMWEHCGPQAQNVIERFQPIELGSINTYFGTQPRKVVFEYCQKSMQLAGGMGTQVSVYVGGFKVLRRGETVDVLEFVRISEAAVTAPGGHFNFAQSSQRQLLWSLNMLVPDHL